MSWIDIYRAARSVRDPATSTDRLVLRSLVDFSDANGKAFPSVASLVEITGLGLRTVQAALRRLEDGGHITRGWAIGKRTDYMIHPQASVTPAMDAPPQDLHPGSICTPPPQDLPPTPAAFADRTTHITTQVTTHLKPLSSDDDGAKVKPDSIPYADIVSAYHEALPMLPRVAKLTDARRKAISVRWRDDKAHQSPDFWRRYFANVARSDFLTGRDGEWNACGFDNLLTVKIFTKACEGGYGIGHNAYDGTVNAAIIAQAQNRSTNGAGRRLTPTEQIFASIEQHRASGQHDAQDDLLAINYSDEEIIDAEIIG
jgi:Helix-turn-helix domain